MKLPRDLSGTEVVRRLARHYGHRVTRSRGSHMTATLTAGGDQQGDRTAASRRADRDPGRDNRRCVGIPPSAQAGSTRCPLRLM